MVYGYTIFQLRGVTMKKFTMFIAILAMLGTNEAFAFARNRPATGKGAAAGANTGSNKMVWLVGLGTAGLVGTVVGLAASSAAREPSTYSH